MKQFGLIGNPLIHSFSKKFFTDKFEQENIDAHYDLFELRNIADFSLLIEQTEFSGINVTIPYKEKIIEFLDELDETAASIGAVNVIKFIRSNGNLILKGYNSDAIGFENSLKPYLQPYQKSALILGTGGASKAIDYVFRKNGIKTTFVSRTKNEGILLYSQLSKEILEENLIIVNTSPVGTYPHSDEWPEIPYEFLSEKHFLYDLVYNPAETLFLKKGKEMGASGVNGESMLIGQALASWEIWNS
jgi:shikimate dehydrogenase